MVSVPTLWVVFLVNFLALALVWTYVQRSYPNFGAARFWTAGAYLATLGAAISMLRGLVDPLIPIIFGSGLMFFACWLGVMGMQRFYGRPVSWTLSLSVTALAVAGMVMFQLWDDMAMRIFIYSLGQSLTLVVTLRLLLSQADARGNPGARLAGAVAAIGIIVHAVRSGVALLHFDGDVGFIEFNGFQAAMMLVLVFLSMVWNFGFLLMAIDRLRGEVADLALVDDLTGIANRRHLLRRLSEECVLSQRTGEPVALLAIDLDGFKEINDGFGHGAGDECLRLFTRAAQSRLRPGDTLARSGGDEFCIVLPATTLREGAMIARHVLETCRESFVRWEGKSIPIAASIGVAQWSLLVGAHPERLIAAADQALYA
ncbi:MAG: diguanylate cyclase, partial [Tardiphaga sp.]|nr:diguanylate cyclase [Tardiphaga sp.]